MMWFVFRDETVRIDFVNLSLFLNFLYFDLVLFFLFSFDNHLLLADFRDDAGH